MSQIRNQRTQRQSGCHDRSGRSTSIPRAFWNTSWACAIQAGDPVCLGGDLRPSTDGDKRSILRAVAKGRGRSGRSDSILGRLPTPALMFDALQANYFSIMVTGSHIPFDKDGVKFNKTWRSIKADKSPILSSVLQTRRLQYAMPAERSLFDDHGWFKDDSSKTWLHPPILRPLSVTLPAGIYAVSFRREASKEWVPGLPALGRRSGLTGETTGEPEPHQVWKVGKSERFVPIDTEDISAEQLNELQRMLEEVIAQGGKPLPVSMMKATCVVH